MWLLTPYKNIWKLFATYWRHYGGAKAVFSSPYLHLSILLTMSMWSSWAGGEWWERPLAILPNIVGFTIGGYAVLVAFGDDDFRKTIAGPQDSGRSSPYMAINASFMHFIMVQIAAILFALIAASNKDVMPCTLMAQKRLSVSDIQKIPLSYAFAFTGYLFFIYALATVIAATANIFRVASWYDRSQKKRSNRSQGGQRTDAENVPPLPRPQGN